MAMQKVLVENNADGTTLITINRPEKRNALFHPLRGAILDALVDHDRDDDVVVMTIN